METEETQSEVDGACPICQCGFEPGEITTECTICRAPHHADCWEYNNGCGKYGCTAAPPTEKLSDLEIPAAYWGRSEKECPACKQVIQAAALRCRHCGATFESARPVDTQEFTARQAQRAGASGLRAAAVWLLIFSVVPCTAPLAAFFGTIWFLRNRARINQLRASQSALPKIGLLVAWVQFAMIVIAGVLYGLTGDRS
jgi:hypothetical protein